jgi:hypothetical protein
VHERVTPLWWVILHDPVYIWDIDTSSW